MSLQENYLNLYEKAQIQYNMSREDGTTVKTSEFTVKVSSGISYKTNLEAIRADLDGLFLLAAATSDAAALRSAVLTLKEKFAATGATFDAEAQIKIDLLFAKESLSVSDLLYLSEIAFVGAIKAGANNDDIRAANATIAESKNGTIVED